MSHPKTLKVVINQCYGGFSLSPQAILALSRLNNLDCYFWKFCNRANKWISITADEIDIYKDHFVAFSQPTIPQGFSEWPIKLHFGPNERHDLTLVQVVENLGEKANGPYANLQVISITPKPPYTINEYDGYENINGD